MRLTTLFTLIWLLTSAAPAFALSDEEYKKFSRESQVFAQAETRLNAAWKKLKAALPKAEYAAALNEQRQWNKSRDAAALDMSNSQKMPLADAYAIETLKRAVALEARAGELVPAKGPAGKSAQDQPRKQGEAREPNAGPGLDITGQYKNQSGSVEIKKNPKGYHVRIATSAPDARWVCLTKGDSELVGNMLTLREPLNSATQGGQAVIRISVIGRDAIVSTRFEPAGATGPLPFCGASGGIDGTYTR